MKSENASSNQNSVEQASVWQDESELTDDQLEAVAGGAGRSEDVSFGASCDYEEPNFG